MAGQSVRDQMYHRANNGKEIMKGGIIATAIFVFAIFVIAGLLVTAKVTVTIPKEINVIVAQHKTIVIADSEVYTIEKAHWRIGRIYFIDQINMYGLCILSTITIDGGDMWERTELWDQ